MIKIVLLLLNTKYDDDHCCNETTLSLKTTRSTLVLLKWCGRLKTRGMICIILKSAIKVQVFPPPLVPLITHLRNNDDTAKHKETETIKRNMSVTLTPTRARNPKIMCLFILGTHFCIIDLSSTFFRWGISWWSSSSCASFRWSIPLPETARLETNPKIRRW